MLDYDGEAQGYDQSRGGQARAAVAAAAVERLLPARARVVVDVACGTGIVTTRWRRPERVVVGVDRSLGMLAKAASRLPHGAGSGGGAIAGDAIGLPLRTASVDALTAIWLLHLLPDAAPVLAEAVRVLSEHGVLITTVDKNEAMFATVSDIALAVAPLRRGAAPRSDDHHTILALADRHGLRPVGETSFPGVNQGRSPRAWHQAIRAGIIPWARRAPDDAIADLCRTLRSLPGQDTPRPDPVYRLIALART